MCAELGWDSGVEVVLSFSSSLQFRKDGPYYIYWQYASFKGLNLSSEHFEYNFGLACNYKLL